MKNSIRYTFFVCFAFIASHLYAHLYAVEKKSSAPYLSGDTFRAHCKFTYDEISKKINPHLVEDGDTIFLKTNYVDEFFLLVHPHINSRYILITHNCDDPISKRFDRHLNDGKIIAWFGQNNESTHSKIHPLPIGLANSYWEHGNTDIVSAMQDEIYQSDKKHLLYMNFQIATYPIERAYVANLFKDCSYCYDAHSKDFRTYLDDMMHSKFVLSPRGNGLDCHRTWEALLMGAIPVVKSSNIDSLFENLPVLIVNEWEEITEEFLNEKYEEMQSESYQIQKLYCDYWFELIDSFIPDAI